MMDALKHNRCTTNLLKQDKIKVKLSPCRFTPQERDPGTHWIGGWVDLRAGVDDLEKRKFLTPPGLELRPLGRPARS
jgi:hypothetical protein